MKAYIDTSVYNRPFDDQTQPRIWLETLSFSVILQFIKSETLELVTSSVIEYENSKNPYPERKRWVNSCLLFSAIHVTMSPSIRTRALQLEERKIRALDAFHLACAESAASDYFLTCDDKLIKRYQRKDMIACNPVEFVLIITEEYHGERSSDE